MSSGPAPRAAAPAGAPISLLGARVRFTGRADGDLRPTAASSSAVLDCLAGRSVSWLRQVHAGSVVVVSGREAVRGDDGDALVTTSADACLAILTADCAPIALASPEGVVGAVHAGWNGLAAGVVQAAVDAMRRLGATRVEAALGPCIHAECYDFGPDELERVAPRLGPGVRGITAAGRPALDLPAAVRSALSAAGASLVADVDVCTACAGDHYFSHRARRETERQAMLVWTPA